MTASGIVNDVDRDGQSQTIHTYMGTFTPSTSYPNTGGTVGEPIAIPKCSHIRKMVATAAGYTTWFDASKQVLHFYRQKDPGATGGADIALPEVANTTDLSAVVVDYVAWGA